MHASGPVLVCRWPEPPGLPPPGQAVLVRVATAQARPPSSRRELRDVLRQVLAAWSGLPAGQLPLEETPRGPVWSGPLGGESLDVSLSYGEEEGWIGLIRGGWIGIDVAGVAPLHDAEDVAQCYLGPLAAARIRAAAHPARAFAIAWTEREARLKCLKQGLTEWTAAQAETEAECHCHRLLLPGRVVGAVCWRRNTSFGGNPKSEAPNPK
jgi:4'-phosphopantetheinyl transferase